MIHPYAVGNEVMHANYIPLIKKGLFHERKAIAEQSREEKTFIEINPNMSRVQSQSYVGVGHTLEHSLSLLAEEAKNARLAAGLARLSISLLRSQTFSRTWRDAGALPQPEV